MFGPGDLAHHGTWGQHDDDDPADHAPTGRTLAAILAANAPDVWDDEHDPDVIGAAQYA